MRKISATYIFSLNTPPIKNGIIVADDDGTILEIIDSHGTPTEIEGLEYYNGIICPGFVNAHCHLELSHMKGKIEKHIQLAGFIKSILHLRNEADEEFQLLAARQADRYMFNSGIVAVGDISNSSNTLETKEASPIYYHTFIECFGFLPQRAPRAMEYANFIWHLYKTSNLSASIVPHAPYSVSEDLFQLINEAANNQSILSIHHQESAEENLMFRSKTGALVDHLTNNLKLDIDFWDAPQQNATEYSISKLPKSKPLLLVHNTYAKQEELDLLTQLRQKQNTFLVTCPSANLYIENQLPDYSTWIKSGYSICIGTDSLASNDTLSILHEMYTIQENFNIELSDLLTWGSSNGAKALGIDNWAGTIEKGKKPGINLISGIDFSKFQLTANSKVKKLL